jgi:hypothetical protein
MPGATAATASTVIINRGCGAGACGGSTSVKNGKDGELGKMSCMSCLAGEQAQTRVSHRVRMRSTQHAACRVSMTDEPGSAGKLVWRFRHASPQNNLLLTSSQRPGCPGTCYHLRFMKGLDNELRADRPLSGVSWRSRIRYSLGRLT